MKFAYQYIRISDKDQSNFSIEGQDRANRQYAEAHGITILDTFIDDGRSAKNFDRPAWKRLETLMRSKHRRVDYLIVMKYDRLIRNVSEGLAFITLMEDSLNIKLLSVMENFFIDPHSPYFFKMRADLLVQGEFERRVISDRSRFGLFSAKNSGRYIGVAPFGYINKRDDQDKPIIVIDPMKAETVKQMYNDLISGFTFEQVFIRAKELDFGHKGHGAVKRLLSNPVYAGLIQTSAYKEQAGKLVKGIHEPIISEEVYWVAQRILNDSIKPQTKSLLNPATPLRGVLSCRCCGHLLTGGYSMGKYKQYAYYRCLNCKGENYSADKSSDELTEVFKELSLTDDFMKLVMEELEQEMDKIKKTSGLQLTSAINNRDQLLKKISSLEEKYIEEKIEQEAYAKWKAVYNGQLQEINERVAEFSRSEDDLQKLYNDNLPLLGDLAGFFEEAEILDKHEIIRGIFPESLMKDKPGYRTPGLNPLFQHKQHKISLLTIGKRMRRLEKTSSILVCAHGETRTPKGIPNGF